MPGSVFHSIAVVLLMALAGSLVVLLAVGHAVNHVLLAGLLLIDDVLDELHRQPKPIEIAVQSIGIPIPPTNWR